MADDTITIRLNKEEREQLNQIKKFLNLDGQFGGESKAIKACISFALNVTQRLFGGNLMGLFVPKKPRKDGSESSPNQF